MIEMPPEFKDVFLVLEFGAQKYPPDGWLNPDPVKAKLTHRSNCDSMFHHLAARYAGIKTDHESELSHYLHLSCRALMAYTREKRGLAE